jgi:two-component system phosphate regulon sensor histidine kinase PhoR
VWDIKPQFDNRTVAADMKLSIKIKFSVFLAVLLLLTVTILSVLVLDGIKKDQQVQYEAYLSQQARTTNLYVNQLSLSEPFVMPETFLISGGNKLAKQLSKVNGQLTVLYDTSGTKIGESVSESRSSNVEKALSYALQNKIAYQVEQDSLYYLAPLTKGGEQVGVVQLNYSLEGYLNFYNYIRTLFIYTGAGVFIVSFILGYFYFNSFANGILKLKNMADRIRNGQYNIEVPHRKDELGKLGEGIYDMSRQILKTMEYMQAEQQKLTLAVSKLSNLEKQQKEFIGNITHEFKTPLTSVKAYLDLLEMYPDDPELMETAREKIKQETERLYEMVDKVLQLSVLEKYDFEYTMEKIDVMQIILQVCSSLKGKMDKFGIQLETELKEVFIEADRENMVIILVNLIDNAIKYNKPQGSIRIKSYAVSSNIFIEISDTGIGMPEEAEFKVFEPFYTVDKNRSRQNGGFGLGLALIKKLVEKQGGTVVLIETGPEGSTFRLCFTSYEID